MSSALSFVFDSLVKAKPPNRKKIVFDTACVLGGSIAGLLAARVLSDFARNVVIIERDELNGSASPRPGVPQGHQIHVLLPTGQRWLERWLPGFTNDAMGRGALISGNDTSVQAYDGHARASTIREYELLCATRPLIETCVRERVLALTNVSILRGSAIGLRYREGVVAAVDFLEGSAASELEADFVVDAMGRPSRVSHWLRCAGFEQPGLERLEFPVNYSTALFERTAASADFDVRCSVDAFSPGNAVDGVDAAALTLVEDDRWMVLLAKCGRDRPVNTLGEFRATCAKLGPIFREVVSGRATDDVRTYRQADSRRRHFTGLRHFPARLVSVGDAVASFNPIYGQGMSSAALHASCLSVHLATAVEFDTAAIDFFRLQKVIVDAAWSMSTAGDRARLDAENGIEMPENVRHQRWAHDQLIRASLVDGTIAELCNDVMYMLRHPSALADPAAVERAVAINGQPS